MSTWAHFIMFFSILIIFENRAFVYFFLVLVHIQGPLNRSFPFFVIQNTFYYFKGRTKRMSLLIDFFPHSYVYRYKFVPSCAVFHRIFGRPPRHVFCVWQQVQVFSMKLRLTTTVCRVVEMHTSLCCFPFSTQFHPNYYVSFFYCIYCWNFSRKVKFSEGISIREFFFSLKFSVVDRSAL